MRNIAFEREGFEQFNAWATDDKKINAKIVALIDDILRDPFKGLGKPEPLKHELQGDWSTRITDEHRLVYKATDEQILIVSCKIHYESLRVQLSRAAIRLEEFSNARIANS